MVGPGSTVTAELSTADAYVRTPINQLGTLYFSFEKSELAIRPLLQFIVFIV